tara:strand:- start:2221 stop:4911 length:2691 start_codon:yes stop_codon:yes gene_type:complete
MFIAFLTLLSALSISGVAIFYSVIGLAAIFPGAFLPVVIMGGVLEVGKLITASWLYRNWKFTPFLLKTYLTSAVIILSLITSMGIFGFLSKAHLEQNLQGDTVNQRIEIINDKIASENVIIERQKKIIERAETSLNRVSNDKSGDIEIEKQNIINANNKLETLLKIESDRMSELTEKLKTLLAVETNNISQLNLRLEVLDADVNALRDKKGLFSGGNHKKAMKLKELQQPERDKINNKIAQANRNMNVLKEENQAEVEKIEANINRLKKEHADEVAKAQSNIDAMRGNVSSNKDDIEAKITAAENKIVSAQNNIDGLIIERQPLESSLVKLEAEVGPVKYIAALAVDVGLADNVDTSSAVRWVIIVLIFVFDPLAVLLLIAANQSLLRRYPPEAPPPPDEIIDLEKPDHDLTFDPPAGKNETPEEKAWNSMISEATQAAQKEQLQKATERLQDWQNKLEEFNKKVPKPEEKPIKIITDEDKKEDKKKEFEERIAAEAKALEDYANKAREEDLIITAPKQEVNIEEETMYDLEPTPEPAVSPILPEAKEPKVLDQFKPKEVRNAKPLEIITLGKSMKSESERIKPDLTEVIESETTLKPAQTDEERDKILKQFHAKAGNYEDITEDELKKERDEANKAQFLADVSLTDEEAASHPPITASRLAFFQDHIDDILRGSTTFENLPPEIAKTCALLMDDRFENPQIITKGSALKEEENDLPKMTTEQLAEKFAQEPDTEDRDISEDELDALLDGFDQPDPEEEGKKYKVVIQNGQKVRVPVEEDQEYKQNEEQETSGNWSKILDIKEPEKNEIILPKMENTEDFEDRTDEELVNVQPENTISPAKISNHKKRMIDDVAYQEKIEARIDDLISKIENKELALDDLTEQDRQVIIDIMNQNG